LFYDVPTTSRGHRRWQVATILLLLVIIIGTPILLARGPEGGNAVPAQRQESQSGPGTSIEGRNGQSEHRDFVENSTGSQVTFLRLSDDLTRGTATERFARPALSLGKLYIADYVLDHGSTEEKFSALGMLSNSSDAIATELYETYPDSIDRTADKYGLLSTRGAAQWGNSVTSTYDVVSFIADVIRDDPTSPILVAMATSAPLAADGYPQDFGTAVLPGVLGTKWGWSDDGMLHSSVSFGEDFVAAAAVTGTADDLTTLVESQLTDLVEQDG
jgi:hypothetical protein